ncbi:MAG: amidohydrolase [Pedosphaera sp.]|nr:amidohydrolase [Pedosphaera sp.]
METVGVAAWFVTVPVAGWTAAAPPTDFVITNANVITVDKNFSRAEALAVRGDKIIAVGRNQKISPLIGASTRVLDARGKTVLPGLIDSHVHSYRAALSEFGEPKPVLTSLAQAFDHIREQAAKIPAGGWIILERVYPTRMTEGRLPTKYELDLAAPNHPVYWNCGPVSMANQKALDVSGITGDTPDPSPGEIVRDLESGAPTGLLRNAAHLLKVVALVRKPTPAEERTAVKKLHSLYNQQGITSIDERRTEFAAIDLFRDLAQSGELTVRVNCTRMMDPVPKTLDECLKKLDEMTRGPQLPGAPERSEGGSTLNSQLSYGPTGAGDDWVRIGPLKVLLDGGMLIGTAYMRQPWGIGDTYQIRDGNYRGLLNVKPELLNALYAEAARRGWQLAAHCTGEAAMDVLLDCYESIQKQTDIRSRRFEICHANFQSAENFKRCRALGIVADVQPAWLYKDGASLLRTLGEERMKWFMPLKSWLANGLTIGGGSDHMVILDSVDGTNPWNPWLGMWIALTRQTESRFKIGMLNPAERLTREQAIRLYTINNAKLTFDEKKKGSLEPGKLADLIVIDRDVTKCPVDEVRATKVLLTMVGGKIVWEGRAPAIPDAIQER